MVVGNRHDFARDANQPVGLGIDFAVRRKKHLQSGDQQERAEDVQHRVEILEQLDAGENENGAHHQGTRDAIEQHLVLSLGRDAKRLKDQQKDEDVVDAERFFH